MLRKPRFQQIYMLCCILAAAAVLIPLLWIGRYAQPNSDDWIQPIPVHEAVLAGGGICEILRAAWQQMVTCYRYFSGLYFSMFLSALSPAVFGVSYYWLVPIVSVVMLLFSALAVLRVVAPGRQRLLRVSAAGLILIAWLDGMPSPAEGLYWFSGSVNYIFCFGLFLLLLALVFDTSARDMKKARLAWRCAIISALSFLLGGGNLTTALMLPCTMAVFLLFILLQKRGRFVPPLLALLFCAAGLIVNVLAPGTASRLTSTESISAPAAVLYAFVNTYDIVLNALTPRFLLMSVLFLPFAYTFAKKSAFSFRYPVLFLIFSVLILASGFVPPQYAGKGSGPLRLKNIQYFLLVLLLWLNEFYWLGFLLHRCSGLMSRLQNAMIPCAKQARRLAHGMLLAAAALLISVYARYFFPTNADYDPAPSSVRAVTQLMSGEAARYASEYEARYALMCDDAVTDVVFPALSAQPELLYSSEWSPSLDASYWVNNGWALYFHKNTVRLQTPEK